jgi:hypothetical protein
LMGYFSFICSSVIFIVVFLILTLPFLSMLKMLPLSRIPFAYPHPTFSDSAGTCILSICFHDRIVNRAVLCT